MAFADSPRAVAQAPKCVLDRDRRERGARGRARPRRHRVGARARRHLSRHEHHRSRCEPRGRVRVPRVRAFMLDAPISGSPVTVKAGQASVMVGGDEAAFERAKPVLLAHRPEGHVHRRQRPRRADEDRGQPAADGRGHRLRRSGGARREGRGRAGGAVDAILKSVAASPVLGYRGPFILEGRMPEVPLADVTLQQKDMLLVLDTAAGSAARCRSRPPPTR